MAAVSGCSSSGKLTEKTRLVDKHTSIPAKKAVIIFVDGVNKNVFQNMLQNGELANINKYLVQRGTSVENATTVVPSITYAVTTTIITGVGPGRHGIVGNKFFDRYRLAYFDFGSMKTYRDPDKNYRTPTIYEILAERPSVSIQVAIRRGAYHKIDNWMTSGIRWFFGLFKDVDSAVARRFALIGKLARKAGKWPSIIFAYFPSTDEMGHRYGPNSEKYRQSLQNVDEQIGKIAKTLQANGLLESTYLLLVSDHGMASIEKQNYIDLEKILQQLSLNITDEGPYENNDYFERRSYFNQYDAVLSNGGMRRVIIYLKNGEDWAKPADIQQITPIAETLAGQKGLALAAYRNDHGIVVQNRRGQGLVERESTQDQTNLDNKLYRYTVIDGIDPLKYTGCPNAKILMDGKYHNGQKWLNATVKSEYPDLLVQIIEVFDAPHSGDLLVFAEDGWDFSGELRGGHGGISKTDMTVPMILAGPNIKQNNTIETARIVDLAPTVVDMIDNKKLTEYSFDGNSLLGQIKETE